MGLEGVGVCSSFGKGLRFSGDEENYFRQLLEIKMFETFQENFKVKKKHFVIFLCCIYAAQNIYAAYQDESLRHRL